MRLVTVRDGAALFAREAGRGAPAIVLVHGWQSTGVTWDPVALRLAGSHRTVVVDLRGGGGSAEAPGPYTVEQFARDVADLIDGLGLGRSVVVGHSMGGATAMRVAIDSPELVAGIVLVAPVPPNGLRLPPHVDARFRATAGNRENFERWLSRMSLEPLPEERFARLSAASTTIRPEVALESYESWTTLDFADEARSITAPTLVLAGEYDRPNLTEERLEELIGAVVPGSRVAVIGDSGHYVPLEQPEATAQAILRFVGGLPASSRQE